MRAYGRTGLDIPVLGFGAMQVGNPLLDDASAARLLHHVLDAGLSLLDTARSYGLAEERIGRHLGRRRDEFVLSTKVGYDIAGVPDWTYDCVVQGVDAARDRLRTDVIEIVHLHSCGLEVLRAGEVTRALHRCIEQGKIRVAAYAGDDVPLRHALESVAFGGLQASVNLCDQQALAVFDVARERGIGTLAKRSLAGRPWAGVDPADAAQSEYHRRFGILRQEWTLAVEDWDAHALRFAAFAPGVDCVIVGGTNAVNVDRNVAAVNRGPLAPGDVAALTGAYQTHGRDWGGLI